MSFRSAREAAGYSQNDVAKQMHVDQSAVSLWESGKSLPSSARLPQLAALYGCPIEDLLTGNPLEQEQTPA